MCCHFSQTPLRRRRSEQILVRYKAGLWKYRSLLMNYHNGNKQLLFFSQCFFNLNHRLVTQEQVRDEPPWSQVARQPWHSVGLEVEARHWAWSQHKYSRLRGSGRRRILLGVQRDRLRPCQPLLQPQNRQPAHGCDFYNDTTKLNFWEEWALCIQITHYNLQFCL